MSKLVFRELTNDTEHYGAFRESLYSEEPIEKLAEIKGNKVFYYKRPEEAERQRIKEFINGEFKI